MAIPLVERILRMGLRGSTSSDEIEQAPIRHATLLACATSAGIGSVALLLSGSLFHAAIAGSVCAAAAVALVLCARGHYRVGVFLALVVTNVGLTMGVTADGADHLAVLHILAVCLPFSLLTTDDRLSLFGAVGLAAVGMLVSTIPLVPSPWMPQSSEGPAHVRVIATIGITAVITVQLWLLLSSRNRTLQRLSVALTEAKAASVAKSAFLANMSHEIRTPINGVLGMIGILEGTKLDPLQREYAQTAQASGMALLDVINDILDLSKVEAGQLRLEPVPFELRSTMEDILDQFASQTGCKALELVLRYVPGTPEHVVADAGRVRQLVNNLVGNAIKFTDAGHVLLTVECMESTTERAVLKISVEDTGPGIPGGRKNEVFDKFLQLDGSATRQHAGTGLGLSITRELVQLMGGTIDVSSTMGKGSTFWFTMPVGLDEAVEVRRSTPAQLASARVLIVDDHPVNRRVLREQVDSWHMHNAQCDGGSMALSLLREAKASGEPFDIAVLDYQMPRMDGIALAKAIKGDPQLADTVLILLTSVSLQLGIDEIKASGFTGYLVKPVHHSELADVLAAALHARGDAGTGPLLTRHLLHEHQRDMPRQDLFAGLRVLVADDNAINQKVAARLLEKLGCRVDIAANGQEVLDMLENAAYDVVFMDVQMPVMDGLEASRRLRERGVATPIIAMTAHAMQGDRERCLAAGMDGYVSKPVRRELLAGEMSKLINPRS